MRRGDIVTIALQGDYGKPRPAVVIQSNDFLNGHPSILLCPITSDLQTAPLLWIEVAPSRQNGLRAVSQIMSDRIVSARPEKIGGEIGHLEAEALERLDAALALVIGLTE